MIDYEENGTDPVATFSATDEDGDAIDGSWTEPTRRFEIDGGVLTFKKSPTSRAYGPWAEQRDNYEVTVIRPTGRQACAGLRGDRQT